MYSYWTYAEGYDSLDHAHHNWRETLQDEILATHLNSNDTEMEMAMDDNDYSEDPPLPVPAERTVKGALDLARQIAGFTVYHGSKELSSAVAKVTDILVNLKFKTQKQSSILDFMKL